MTARLATPEEISQWDTRILANPDGGNVFSSYEYSKIKELNEYTPVYVVAGAVSVTVLEKTARPFGKFWYLPKGPNVTSAKELVSILEALKPLAQKHGVFVVRAESEVLQSEAKVLVKHGLEKAAPIIPNPSTITLSIANPLEDVLMSLPQKGRHAIRRAERDGVRVELVEANEKNCKAMYKLLSETAEGQFGIRSYNYYRYFWQTFESAKLGQLFFAYFEGELVAGAYAMTFGTKSTYKDGASIRKRITYGASHFLQWKVIEWAKSRGATLHDFCGSPPSNRIDDPTHPHHGVGMFKTAFNKQVTDYIGCYDLVLSSTKYTAWKKIGERLHRRLYFKRTNDYYY